MDKSRRTRRPSLYVTIPIVPRACGHRPTGPGLRHARSRQETPLIPAALILATTRPAPHPPSAAVVLLWAVVIAAALGAAYSVVDPPPPVPALPQVRGVRQAPRHRVPQLVPRLHPLRRHRPRTAALRQRTRAPQLNPRARGGRPRPAFPRPPPSSTHPRSPRSFRMPDTSTLAPPRPAAAAEEPALYVCVWDHVARTVAWLDAANGRGPHETATARHEDRRRDRRSGGRLHRHHRRQPPQGRHRHPETTWPASCATWSWPP